MTLRSHKKLPTTAPMVQVGTTRKSKLCRSVLRSASTFLFAGAALVVSQSAFGQEENPARYAPPVHVQPAAWSVLEEPSATAPATQADTSRAREIANMAQYMRMQNQAVTSAQDAKVNAALNQLQQARTDIAQSQRQTQSVRVPAALRNEFPRTAPAAQTRPAPQVQPLYVNPRSDVATRAVPKRTTPTAQRQQTTQRQVVQQRPVQQRQAIQQPASRRGIGLQDRISQAIKKTFTRPEQVNEPQSQVAQNRIEREPARNIAQQIPTRSNTRSQPQIALVDHTVDANANRSEIELPMLVDPPTAKPMSRAPVAKTARRMPRQLEYRPQRTQNDRVIVPSFVEAETEVLPELRLASTQEAIGSGLRRPRVSSHSQPMSYGSARPARQEVSVFKNASTQLGSQRPQETNEEIEKIKEEFERRRSDSDNELPQRTNERPGLLDMSDENTADEARRARSSVDAEMDSLEDDADIEEDDEEVGPPVFDDRSCEELRGLLLDKSIRDISLDLSPPASARRGEQGSLSRSWTDASGNVLATGTMVDLRRGYVILESGQRLPYAKLSEADWSAIADNWLLPTVCSIGQRGTLERNWAPMTVSWHASSLCHKPLYFENIQLERYGHSRGPFMQPIHSAFHFFGSIIFLPYNRAINPPNECQYSLGFYRPGNCAPWLLDPIPFSREGIRRQAVTSLGLGFIP